MGYIVGEKFIPPAGRRGRRPLQMGSYHFPLAIRPPTKMAEKMATKRKNVIQSGASTQNQDHEISPIAFSTTKIRVNATTGSNPGRSERLAFFIRIIPLEMLIDCFLTADYTTKEAAVQGQTPCCSLSLQHGV